MAEVCISLVAVNTIKRNFHSKISCFVPSTDYGKLLGISQKTIFSLFCTRSLFHFCTISLPLFQTNAICLSHTLPLLQTYCPSFFYIFILFSTHKIYLFLFQTYYLSVFHSFIYIIFFEYTICLALFHLYTFSFKHTLSVCISFKHTVSLSHIISLSKHNIFLFLSFDCKQDDNATMAPMGNREWKRMRSL